MPLEEAICLQPCTQSSQYKIKVKIRIQIKIKIKIQIKMGLTCRYVSPTQ